MCGETSGETNSKPNASTFSDVCVVREGLDSE